MVDPRRVSVFMPSQPKFVKVKMEIEDVGMDQYQVSKGLFVKEFNGLHQANQRPCPPNGIHQEFSRLKEIKI